MPGSHVAIEVLVEMGVPIDGIAADDQPGHPMGTELDGRQ
jgi:hypothetical protein